MTTTKTASKLMALLNDVKENERKKEFENLQYLVKNPDKIYSVDNILDENTTDTELENELVELLKKESDENRLSFIFEFLHEQLPSREKYQNLYAVIDENVRNDWDDMHEAYMDRTVYSGNDIFGVDANFFETLVLTYPEGEGRETPADIFEIADLKERFDEADEIQANGMWKKRFEDAFSNLLENKVPAGFRDAVTTYISLKNPELYQDFTIEGFRNAMLWLFQQNPNDDFWSRFLSVVCKNDIDLFFLGIFNAGDKNGILAKNSAKEVVSIVSLAELVSKSSFLYENKDELLPKLEEIFVSDGQEASSWLRTMFLISVDEALEKYPVIKTTEALVSPVQHDVLAHLKSKIIGYIENNLHNELKNVMSMLEGGRLSENQVTEAIPFFNAMVQKLKDTKVEEYYRDI